MNRFRAMWRRAKVLTAVCCCWLALQAAALAAPASPGETKPAEGGGTNQYLASYGIVLLGIGLGLLFVCNSARRRDRAKPEQYGE
jgi:uncharacterized membrane protein